ncbi:MAG: helix-hairpin-helix domain-containing protein [Phormidesmis sp.]
MLKKLFSNARSSFQGPLQHPLKKRLQQEPYYRFASFEEMQLAASWGVSIDANTASVDEWLRLPGLSIHQARTLQALTSKGLSFSCIEDVAAAIALPTEQIRPWEAMLQFCYYDREAALTPTAVNANTAAAEELATVPNLDIFLGRAIVHYRQQGPYRDLADLQDRLRLTTAVTAQLLHYLSF